MFTARRDEIIDTIFAERHEFSCAESLTMEIVKLSSGFRVVIPKEIRELLNLKPGQKLKICIADGSICLRVPRSIESLRGIAKGMEWKDSYREH